METKINKLELSHNEQLKSVCTDICSTLHDALTAFGRDGDNSVRFNREWFRIDIIIGNNEHHISVQGRGADIELYYESLLEIIKTEVVN